MERDFVPDYILYNHLILHLIKSHSKDEGKLGPVDIHMHADREFQKY